MPPEGPLIPGKTCRTLALADRCAIVIDAADYFRAAREAMLNAKEQILLICWDFDPRIKLDPDDDSREPPNRLGAFILWLARRRPKLHIHILVWNLGALKLFGRGSAALTAFRWARRRNITFKFDSAHPIGAAHHQKIVVIDDAFAFCGGIDMTADRWDTPAHIDDDPRRRRPSGEAYGPWHDVTAAVDGEAARALGIIARERWEHASGEQLPVPSRTTDQTIWPSCLQPDFTHLPVAISRTCPSREDQESIREIEALYLEMIATARSFIYAENQYFASRKIAEALAARLAEPDPPEIVLINPETADGPLQEEVMGSARARLMEALRRIDHRNRFRIYTPATEGGEAIYVHAKVMIVDDRLLRIGSSNHNNRSLGLDTECDVTIDADRAREDDSGVIAALRDRLMGEHLGVDPSAVARLMAQTGSLIAVIDQLRGKGKTLAPFVPPALNETEKLLADSAALDPESPEEMFEPFARRGLFQHWRSAYHRLQARPWMMASRRRI